MGSGFLLAIVLGLWVIVLYPTFAKNRVNSNETKSIDHFNKAMRSISDLVPTRGKEEITQQRKAALRRRNVTYLLFITNVGVIVASFFGYVSQYVSLIPVGLLILWLVIVYIAAQRMQTDSRKIQKAVIRKSYVIYKKPVAPKTLIKPDPERDLIMDERPVEKIIEPNIQEVQVVTEQRRAHGA